jgi:anti-sigma regulatory factor (Ser/Thr protein kinase)
VRHDRELAHHQRFVADPTAARSARRTLEMFTPELGSDVVQTLQLLATELVGDAVTHAGRDIVELDLSVTRRRVRLTVTDAGPGSARPLTSMTDRWGTRSDDRNRVWVEIDRSPHAERCAARPLRSRRRPPRGRPLCEGLS